MVVVGSGAGGGTAVQVLTEKGIKVALLEAGPMLDLAKEFKEHKWPYEVQHRGAEDGGAAYFGKGKPFGYFTTTGGWELDGEPYTVGEGSEFQWFRSRISAGGQTTTAACRSASPITTSSRIEGRPGIRLAHHLRRNRALVRQGRGSSSASAAATRVSAARRTACSKTPTPESA